jgi:transposase-like protein
MGNKFSTQEECLSYLEKMRWCKTIKCPYCHSERTHLSKNEQGRHYCYNCVKSFSVFVGTIFEDTRLELPVWFQVINAMLKNKTGLSATQISSQYGITLKTAWLTAMKIRCAMIDHNSRLHGLLHLDENHFASKEERSKKLGKHIINAAGSLNSNETNIKEGKKTEIKSHKSSNKPKLKVIEEITPMSLLGMLKHYVHIDKEAMIKKRFRSYSKMDKAIEQISDKQSEQKKTKAAVNSVEAYWDDIRNGIRGNYKSLSEKYLPFYLVEYEYKFNRRNKRSGLFSEFIKNAVSNKLLIPEHKLIKIKRSAHG